MCDQYLNYICLDKRLFSLEMKNSYFTLKNPKITETEVDDYVNQIVTSLHSVFATLGQIPFIRYQPSTVGEAVAKRLCDSIGNAILSRTLSEIFSGNGSQFSGQECRPLLILIDRSIDVTTMVSHQWSYASLVQDVFEVNINRISHVDNKSKKTVYYDIDSDDAFWEKNSSLTLPEVTENLSKDISECKIAFDDLKKDYNIDLNENFDMKSLAPNTSALISAMKQVPLVTEKKRILDMHMKIATRIMDSVRERSLDMLFSAEDSVHKQSPSAIMSIIADKRIQPEDKLRLFIVYYLSNKDESSTDMSKFEEALKSAGCDTAPLKYLREVRKLTQLSTLKGTPSTSNIQQPTNIFGKVSNIGSKISGHLKESGVSSHIENLMSNVRQLLPVSKSLPVTRIIESLSENRIDSTTHQEYVLLDPKITSSPHKDLDQGQSPTRDSVPVIFTNVVVFVIGGGNVIEYHNAMETVKDSAERSLIYGTTEIASPQVFLEQLHALGMSKS